MTARLTAGPGFEHHLRRLAPRFRTVTQRIPGTAELEVDDLLANLIVLSAWPVPESVLWEPALAKLAIEVTQDAQTIADRLNDPVPDLGAPLEAIATMLGPQWRGNLTAFQERDVRKLLGLRHGANFSVPGAGKTRVGLAVFAATRHRGLAKRLLVVGPKSSFEAWQQENEECFIHPLRMEVAERTPSRAAEVLIVNYERLDGRLDGLAAWLSEMPSMLILDEAHRMKLGAAGTHGAACLALGPRARRRLILTGTPAPNGVRDLENLFGFVWPGQGRQSVTRAVSSGSLAMASQALKPLFARTTKDELGLPEVSTSIRRVPLPPLHREIYDALISQFSPRAIAAQDDFQALGKVMVYLLMAATSPALLAVGTTRYEPLAYQVPPLAIPIGAPLVELMRDLPSYEMSPKYQETLAIVAANAAMGRKTIVWSTFVRSIKTLERILSDFSPAIVFGGTEDRDEQIKRFRNDADCMVLLSNPATLGEGISLHHECHDAIYVDRDFAAGRFLQSLDRIHRLGLRQDQETRITVLSAEGTIDEVVEQRLEVKLKFMGRILDDPAVEQLGDLYEEPAVGGGLAPQDLQSLMGHLRADPS
jgi:SNF2 family DNA or RNA helicase